MAMAIWSGPRYGRGCVRVGVFGDGGGAMKIPVAQKPRYGRGNLAAAQRALSQGDILEVVRRINAHAFNRQKTGSGKK